MNWSAFSILIIIFISVMIIFSKEEMDYVVYALIFALLSCIVTFLFYGTSYDEFLLFIDFKPLVFIFSMQIIISISERYQLFQWVALKTLHLTKGNHRKFFYLICTISTIMASIIADVTVVIIFVPLVIRACKILNIKSAPYLFGITITINIGSIWTPFSSSENIIISEAFGLNFLWFMQYSTPFVIFTLIVTLVLLDYTTLKKIEPPEDHKKAVLLEIMNPNLVIVNKKQFRLNGAFLILVIIGLVVIDDSYLVALFGALLLGLLDKVKLSETIKKVDWNLIFFILSLFLMVGCMEVVGIFDLVSTQIQGAAGENILYTALIVLIVSSLMSGFLANAPTTIAFITIIGNMYGSSPPALVALALLLGVNLGGNLLPQGAACDVMTLNLAIKNNVEGFTYKTFLKKGGAFGLFHLFLCILCIIIMSFII